MCKVSSAERTRDFETKERQVGTVSCRSHTLLPRLPNTPRHVRLLLWQLPCVWYYSGGIRIGERWLSELVRAAAANKLRVCCCVLTLSPNSVDNSTPCICTTIHGDDGILRWYYWTQAWSVEINGIIM